MNGVWYSNGYCTLMVEFSKILFQVEVDDDDEAIGDDGDDGYNPNEMKIKSGIAKSVHDQVITKLIIGVLNVLYSFPKYSVVPKSVHDQVITKRLFN